MSSLKRTLLLLPLLALVAADAAPTKIVRLCLFESRERTAIVASPDSLERQALSLHNTLRRNYYSYNRAPLMKITLSGAGRDAVIKEIEPYPVPAAQLQRDAYVFQSLETVGDGAKATVRLKLTRFDEPVDVILPVGPEGQLLATRAKKFKKGDVITARFRGTDNTVYDLDAARAVVRGIYIKDADTVIDGKKFPGVLLDVSGEEVAFALPPAGQKNRTGDADVLTLCRKLKKGAPVRLTCDSERLNVIRTIEPDLTIYPVGKDDLLLEAPGIRLHMNLQPERGYAYGYFNPAPVNDADADLLAGFRDGNSGEERVQIPSDKRSKVYELVGNFAQRKQVDDDRQAIHDRMLRFTMGRPYDLKRVLPEVSDIALDLSARYRHEVGNTYSDIRLLLGKDVADQLQKRGREVRARGEIGNQWND